MAKVSDVASGATMGSGTKKGFLLSLMLLLLLLLLLLLERGGGVCEYLRPALVGGVEYF